MLFRNAKHHSISLRRVFPAIRGVFIPLLPVKGPYDNDLKFTLYRT
nr:MAG TPA: hypothetical protein [Caudoviricetes sp.]